MLFSLHIFTCLRRSASGKAMVRYSELVDSVNCAVADQLKTIRLGSLWTVRNALDERETTGQRRLASGRSFVHKLVKRKGEETGGETGGKERRGEETKQEERRGEQHTRHR